MTYNHCNNYSNLLATVKMLSNRIDELEKKIDLIVDKLDIKDDTKIAFFGVEGSYAEQAMLNYFGENVKGISYDTFEKVMKSVKEGETLIALLDNAKEFAEFLKTSECLLLSSLPGQIRYFLPFFHFHTCINRTQSDGTAS